MSDDAVHKPSHLLHDEVGDYVLEVHYGDAEPTTRIALTGLTADEAELRRRSLLTEIEHAVEIEAPLMWSESTDAEPRAGVPIDPTRVTSVDLVAPFPSDR